ncbi:unnamed protein product [Bursaphelenchus okinawaensis]|uniref:Uncharacterized protein n=1 Tax=Bursaphelenchus okinawaensis TaxID=465554 RepID=A0A811KTS8_9BILA|nr:unnamed protein product [Bursaphelenchus okinawaensis]CAG9109809.1 unnamed protein product [Bursaphelenchus okinawaensis]
MHMRRRSSVTPTGQVRSSSGSRKQSLVEAAEAHFDKNTVIMIVNVVILLILIAILYLIATSTMNVAVNHPYTGHEHYYKHDKEGHVEN